MGPSDLFGLLVVGIILFILIAVMFRKPKRKTTAARARHTTRSGEMAAPTVETAAVVAAATERGFAREPFTQKKKTAIHPGRLANDGL